MLMTLTSLPSTLRRSILALHWTECWRSMVSTQTFGLCLLAHSKLPLLDCLMYNAVHLSLSEHLKLSKNKNSAIVKSQMEAWFLPHQPTLTLVITPLGKEQMLLQSMSPCSMNPKSLIGRLKISKTLQISYASALCGLSPSPEPSKPLHMPYCLNTERISPIRISSHPSSLPFNLSTTSTSLSSTKPSVSEWWIKRITMPQ